jgi:hypothetical protein
MPIKSFSDAIWAEIQAASTLEAFEENTPPLDYVHNLCRHVLATPDFIPPAPVPEVTIEGNTLADETARADAAEAELARQREIITRLLAAPAAENPDRTRGDKIPDPPMFDGYRDKLRPFIAQLRLKLANNQGRFPTEQHRMAYTVNRLEGRALAQILPFVNNDGQVTLDNVAAVITTLQTAFGDPDRAATARHKLQSLRQGNKEFSVYFAEFQMLVAELNWDATATMDALRNGLSIDILEKLIGLPAPASYHDFVTTCQRLDSQIRAVEALRKLRSPPSSSSTRPQAPINHVQPRTSQGTFAPVPAPAPDPTPASFGPAPMDLSANR